MKSTCLSQHSRLASPSAHRGDSRNKIQFCFASVRLLHTLVRQVTHGQQWGKSLLQPDQFCSRNVESDELIARHGGGEREASEGLGGSGRGMQIDDQRARQQQAMHGFIWYKNNMKACTVRRMSNYFGRPSPAYIQRHNHDELFLSLTQKKVKTPPPPNSFSATQSPHTEKMFQRWQRMWKIATSVLSQPCPLGCSATRKHFHTASICILHLNGLAALELELQAVKLIGLLGHLRPVFLTAGD